MRLPRAWLYTWGSENGRGFELYRAWVDGGVCSKAFFEHRPHYWLRVGRFEVRWLRRREE